MDLEKKVEELERRISALEAKERPPEPVQQYSSHVIPPMRRNAPAATYEHPEPMQKRKQRTINEQAIGKYIVPVLSALLVFLAAVSFVALVWDQLSNEGRLAILVCGGLFFCCTGFLLRDRFNRVLMSTVIGMGSGILYISIISANLAFNFIDNSTMLCLVGAWTLFFWYSYRFIKMFFLVVVSYVGSFTSVIFGLTLSPGESSFVAIMVFAVVVMCLMIVTSFTSFGRREQITAVFGSMLNAVAILIYAACCAEPFMFKYVVVMSIYLYALQNAAFAILKERVVLPGISAFLSSLAVMICAFQFSSVIYSGQIGDVACLLFALIIGLVQICAVGVFHPKITRFVDVIYAVQIAIYISAINSIINDATLGLTTLAAILLIVDIFSKRSRFAPIVSLLVLADSVIRIYIVFNAWNTVNGGFILLGFLSILTICATMAMKYLRSEFNRITFFKTVLAPALVLTACGVACSIGVVGEIKEEISLALSYTSGVAALIIMVAAGVFSDWEDEDFQFFKRGISFDGSRIALYVIQVILYFSGLGILGSYRDSTHWGAFFMVMISAIAISVVQSALIISRHKDLSLLGIWIGLKYTILVWTILASAFDLGLESIHISIAGLVVAIFCIVSGFMFRVKSLRLYGLIVTIIMVLKVLVVDIPQENSATSILMLLLGGAICFGISAIYNTLSKRIDC